MSPPYAALPAPVSALSTDDMLMGEILMSLKNRGADDAAPVRSGDVGAPPSPTSPSSSGATYRTKVGLTVQVGPPYPLPASAPSPFPSSSAFDLASLSAVSPMASSAFSSAADRPTASPTGRALTPSASSKRYAPVVQLEDLRRCFNMPIAAVARKFGICATLLKKICRRHGIQRWPHRQIRSLQKSIDMLRESLAVAKGSNREYIGKKIAAFELTLECIMQDPNTAARGIAAGRLASPAVLGGGGGGSSAPPAGARRRASTTALLSPTLSAMGARPAPEGGLSDDEELRGSRLAKRRSSMSLEAILC